MSTKTPYVFDVDIPGGATGQSAAINISQWDVVGIIVPTGWATANITFLAADPRNSSGNPGVTGRAPANTVFASVYTDAGTELVFTVPATLPAFISVARADTMSGVNYLKLRSGTTATPVNQTTTKTLTLVCREM